MPCQVHVHHLPSWNRSDRGEGWQVFREGGGGLCTSMRGKSMGLGGRDTWGPGGGGQVPFLLRASLLICILGMMMPEVRWGKEDKVHGTGPVIQ